MKKFLFLITMLAFCVSGLNAAPEDTEEAATQPTRQVKTKKVAKKVAKKATKKTTATKSKAEERKEAQQREFGLMPSEVNNQNRNVFAADAVAIRGAKDTESALRYIPFVTIVNTTGFGNQFDLRGQGRISANGLNFKINGIPMTPLDTYYGFMPINTVLPSLIQQVDILPGVENRGGTINIITSKTQAPYLVAGAGYVNARGSEGASYNAFAQAADDINPKTKLNAGLAFTQIGGPREDDSVMGAQGVLGVDYQLGSGNIIFDADFFYGKTKTTPYNSFLDSKAIEKAVNDYTGVDTNRAGLFTTIEKDLSDFEPSKDNRSTKGDGEIESTQTRFVGSAGYAYEMPERLKFDGIVFYAFDERKFDKHEMYIPYYSYASSKWAPYKNTLAIENVSKAHAWNFLDQTGSSFKESKLGVMLDADIKHEGGEFFIGYHGVYETSKRTPVQKLRQALNGDTTGGVNANNVEILIDNQLDITKFTNTFYIKERYEFNSYFSILGGFKYELLNFDVKASDKMSLNLVSYDSTTDSIANSTPVISNKLVEGAYKKDYDNFMFELAPAFRYSDTGAVYGRFETGYITPPGYAILARAGKFDNANPTKAFDDFKYSDNSKNIKQESYMTGELGWRELIGTRTIPLGFTSFDLNALLFSVSGFWTQSKDEFYFEGDAYSGLEYKSYDKSRRMGVEVALEQYFFDGILGFNESYTWLRAQYLNNTGIEEKWDTIPYTYDYKATLGVNVNVSAFVEVIDVSLGVWLQNSLYGNQKIIDRGFDGVDKETKLEPYVISDFGVSIGFNKDMGVITTGVKNVFDTFYYDYYNNDRTATINENRYIIGRGRTVFIEGTFKY